MDHFATHPARLRTFWSPWRPNGAQSHRLTPEPRPYPANRTRPRSTTRAGTANGYGPHIDESPRAHFEAGCQRGVLLFQHDGDKAVFYPRALPGLTWRESTGRGTVHATTTIRPRGDEPRNVALIDLDEGFRMMSRVIGEHAIGTRVLVDFEEGVPVFRPLS